MRQAELLELAGITYRQLDHWNRSGYVQPEGGAPGSGRPRSWSAHEVAVTVLLGRLVHAGLEVPAAAALARRVLEEPTGFGLYELVPGVSIWVTAPERLS